MTRSRDDRRGPGLSLEEARREAQRFLDEHDWNEELVTGRHRETPEAWVFVAEARSGEPYLGNPVLVVDRFSGEVDTPQEGGRLLEEPELSWLQRVRRWWASR